MENRLTCPDIELLVYHVSHKTVIHQQSSVRGRYGFVGKLTATRELRAHSIPVYNDSEDILMIIIGHFFCC